MMVLLAHHHAAVAPRAQTLVEMKALLSHDLLLFRAQNEDVYKRQIDDRVLVVELGHLRLGLVAHDQALQALYHLSLIHI